MRFALFEYAPMFNRLRLAVLKATLQASSTISAAPFSPIMIVSACVHALSACMIEGSTTQVLDAVDAQQL